MEPRIVSAFLFNKRQVICHLNNSSPQRGSGANLKNFNSETGTRKKPHFCCYGRRREMHFVRCRRASRTLGRRHQLPPGAVPPPHLPAMLGRGVGPHCAYSEPRGQQEFIVGPTAEGCHTELIQRPPGHLSGGLRTLSNTHMNKYGHTYACTCPYPPNAHTSTTLKKWWHLEVDGDDKR